MGKYRGEMISLKSEWKEDIPDRVLCGIVVCPKCGEKVEVYNVMGRGRDEKRI